jgi:rhamnopyranosyl-N-acetylglucosaminyl-diphospho-decaprenol beta-1,3/1,4-galactofuranosyltransferase
MMKIAAVIVTRNRRLMLFRLLQSLMDQIRKPDGIIVVDNGSEDGTVDFLKTFFPHVQILDLQHNVGLFGGLEIGTQFAVRQGYDAVWWIDDDAWLRPDTLESLLRCIESIDNSGQIIVYCAAVGPDGKSFTEPVTVIVDREIKTYFTLNSDLQDQIYETIIGPNIGVYVPRYIIEHIGPPRADMVFCGEYEFLFRARKSGFKAFRCFRSIVYHKIHKFASYRLFGKILYISIVPPWHTYYEVRNMVYVMIKYEQKPLGKIALILLIYLVGKLYACDEKILTFWYILRGIFDGFCGRLGMRVQIPR